ncbi:MAG: hypothetical protein ACI8W8_004874, partial [Rhodothermales bacterium]
PGQRHRPTQIRETPVPALPRKNDSTRAAARGRDAPTAPNKQWANWRRQSETFQGKGKELA